MWFADVSSFVPGQHKAGYAVQQVIEANFLLGPLLKNRCSQLYLGIDTGKRKKGIYLHKLQIRLSGAIYPGSNLVRKLSNKQSSIKHKQDTLQLLEVVSLSSHRDMSKVSLGNQKTDREEKEGAASESLQTLDFIPPREEPFPLDVVSYKKPTWKVVT